MSLCLGKQDSQRVPWRPSFAAMLLAVTLAATATAQAPQAEADPPAVPADEEVAPHAVPAEGKEPATPPEEPAEPKKTFVSRSWFLLSHEDERIGYENYALYRIEGRPPTAWRLEVYRFLKAAAADMRPGFLEKSTMEMDDQWAALRFTTTQTGMGDPFSIEGNVADGRLTVAAKRGNDTDTSTIDVEGRPTFAGAFLFWLARQELAEGKTYQRAAISEQNGVRYPVPRVARVMQAITLETPAGHEDGFIVIEQDGAAVTGHLFRRDGRLFRSEGQNHNRAAQEIPAADAVRLDLKGKVPWQNHIEGLTGNALASETYGYTATLPDYPWLPTASTDGQFVSTDHVAGHEGVHLLAQTIPTGDADAAQKLFAGWSRLLGPTDEVRESKTTVDGLPAAMFEGKATMGGRPTRFTVAVVARQHLGYLIGEVGIGPGASVRNRTYTTFLDGIRWTRIFGRERGHWNGDEYISESYGYRLRLLGPGWRVPQDRSGVATSIEAVRDDHSAMLAVLLEAADSGKTLEQLADDYTARISKMVPGAGDVRRTEATLDGRAAIRLAYAARAIDDEPTESRHILALDGGRLIILTFVGKTKSLEKNLQHFDRAVESFRFGPASE